MNRNKTNNSGPHDFDSMVSNTLSKAIDNIQTVANAMSDRRLSPPVNISVQGISATAPPSNISNSSYSLQGNWSAQNTTPQSLINCTPGGSYPWQYGTSISLSDNGALYPKVDIYEAPFRAEGATDAIDFPGYRVDIYVAGIAKEDITMHLEEGAFIGTTFYAPKMNIKVAKKSEQKTKTYALKESKHSYSNRTVSLPVDANVQRVSIATFKNGVLSFLIQKLTEPKSPTTIVPVEIQ